jgi:hypothetical protein
MKKIDFFRPTSHVDFLKAHIQISYLPNFQNFVNGSQNGNEGPKTVTEW